MRATATGFPSTGILICLGRVAHVWRAQYSWLRFRLPYRNWGCPRSRGVRDLGMRTDGVARVSSGFSESF